MVVVLGAWYYTRAAGTDVVHVAMTTAASGDESQALTSVGGSVVTAATGILADWYTGILSDWYTGGLVYWFS